jgi:hypothetical protein
MDRGEEPSYEQFFCYACQKRLGIATVTAMEIFYPAMVSCQTGRLNRKLSRKLLVCAQCFADGQLTVVANSM